MAASTGLRVAAEAAPQMRPNSAGADPTVSPTTLPIQNASTPALSSAATSACKSAVSSAPSCAKGVSTAGITPLIANSGIGESEFITTECARTNNFGRHSAAVHLWYVQVSVGGQLWTCDFRSVYCSWCSGPCLPATAP